MISNKKEKVLLLTVCFLFFLGIWHGYPFTNIVADEMFFSGSVLRSIDNHTFLPLPLDVPYGTLTFYISYIFISVGLLILFIFSGLKLYLLKLLVINNPFLVYFFSRLVSLSLAIFSIYFTNYTLKKYISDLRIRFLIMLLLFTNILVYIIFHTSKVWVLSTVLMLISFQSLVHLFESDQINKKYIWSAVIFAFLSFSNFPLMGINLIVLPLIYYRFRNNNEIKKTLYLSTCIGLSIFSIILLSNFHGVIEQVRSIIFDYILSKSAVEHNLTLYSSISSHIRKVVLLFPILIFTWIYLAITSKVKYKPLFNLSSFYFSLYIIIIILVDRWSIGDTSSLRYLFPIPFFLLYLFASYEIKLSKVLVTVVSISLLFLIPTIYFLSVSTSSHELVSYLKLNYSNNQNVVFINNVGVDAPIPENKNSYLLKKESECGSLCKETIKLDLHKDFKPYVVDAHTDNIKAKEVLKNLEKYYIERSPIIDPSYIFVKSFTNPGLEGQYFTADGAGNYWNISYFMIKRFGPDLYVYKRING